MNPLGIRNQRVVQGMTSLTKIEQNNRYVKIKWSY